DVDLRQDIRAIQKDCLASHGMILSNAASIVSIDVAKLMRSALLHDFPNAPPGIVQTLVSCSMRIANSELSMLLGSDGMMKNAPPGLYPVMCGDFFTSCTMRSRRRRYSA